MTKKELSRLYILNHEIELDKQKLSELESASTNISVNITGLPHVQGISNKTALAAEIADMRNVIEAKIQITIAEYNKLSRYIASIDDSLMRQIISLRYVDGMSWVQVAMSIGGGNTDKNIQMMLNRFLGNG